MHVLSVVGARPQFVKLAPVAEALARAGDVAHRVLHTGQHYDPEMSEVFFADLALPSPDVELGVGPGSLATQTAAMLTGIEQALLADRPDWVLVYGDTTSTLAGALASVRLGVPVAHLEAGLRSFNRRMPEEHNRVLTDHAADLLLAPTATAVENLRAEGLAGRTRLVGDVMTDVCLRVRDAVLADPPALPGLDSSTDSTAPFLLATVHRAENTDDPVRLAAVVDALAALPVPVLLPVHPRLADRCRAAGIDLATGALRPVAPLSYPQTVAALIRAAGVVTDSGGLQKEAYLLGTPCTTLRHETEWVETLEGGWNVLAGDLAGLDRRAVRPVPPTPRGTPYGDGTAAAQVLDALRVNGSAAC